MKTRNLLFVVVLWLVAGMIGAASAIAGPERARHDRFEDTTRDTRQEIFGHFSHQHGPSAGHLPPTQQNVALVGKAKLTEIADRISDVAVLGDHAYLGQWAAGLPSPRCRGGVHVTDISNPSDPEKIGFLQATRTPTPPRACRPSTSTPRTSAGTCWW
jgi:LVIVD repeat